MTEQERQGPGGSVVRPADAVPRQAVDAGRDTAIQVLLGPDEGAPNFVMRRFIMERGGGIPTHSNAVEHEQYVLRGRARVTVGDAVHEVGADDTLFIPAGVTHSYDVLEGPFEFLCVVPNTPDHMHFPDED
ncbi:MAG TPA: cupin domain-containing protein [Longimicrobiales bacterium]|nr:cupin domain-containing protein [Longimicrobiales bacterium]